MRERGEGERGDRRGERSTRARLEVVIAVEVIAYAT